MIRRAALLASVLLAACSPATDPTPAAPTSAHSCPEGSSWNGTLCVRGSDSPITTTTTASTSPPPRPSSDRERAEARQRFSAAAQFYSQGDYAHALTEFKAAYQLAPTPAVLYNIGVTCDQLGLSREALDAYVEYRASGPPKERIVEVDAKIASLKRALGMP